MKRRGGGEIIIFLMTSTRFTGCREVMEAEESPQIADQEQETDEAQAQCPHL